MLLNKEERPHAEHLPACDRCYPLIMLLFGLRIICGAAVAISWRR
nr:MAG TPA: hypothetical protein [Caudoviricetes sp.]